MKKGALFLALSIMLLSGCQLSRPLTSTSAEEQPSSPVVARYDGKTLTLDDFEHQMIKALGDSAKAIHSSFEERVDFLKRYVDFRLKVLAARDQGYDRIPEVRAEIERYRLQLARPFLIDKKILDPLIQELYERQKEEINASHILIRVHELDLPPDTLAAYQKLTAIRDSILSGALTFEEAALKYSQDPSAKQNQGELGYFTGGQLVYPFENMAYRTPVDSISSVFRTRFGYHILRVNDRRPRQPDVRAAHILIRPKGRTPEDTLAARVLAEALRKRALQGESFEALARQFSQDASTAQHGGDLGYFSPSRVVEPFARALARLDTAGAISEVVRTRFGYHVIKLLDRKTLPSYEEAYPELKKLVARLPRAKEAEQKMGRAYRESHGSRVDSALIYAALDSLHTSKPFSAILSRGFPKSMQSMVFATIGDETYTLGDLQAYIRERKPTIEPLERDQFFILVDRFLNEKALDVAATELEETNPSFQQLMEDYIDGILLFRIMEDSVWNVAMQDTTALKAFFEAHAENYRYPQRTRVISLFGPADSLVQQATAAFLAGTPADTLKAQFQVEVDTTYLTGPSRSIYDRVLSMEEGAHTQPIAYRNGFIVLIHDGTVPPRPKTFKEARAEVIADYQKVLEEQWLERLRARYQVMYYPEYLHQAFTRKKHASTG